MAIFIEKLLNTLKRIGSLTIISLIAGSITIVISIIIFIKSPINYNVGLSSGVTQMIYTAIESKNKDLEQLKMNYEVQTFELKNAINMLQYKIDTLKNQLTKPDNKISNDQKILIRLSDINASIEKLQVDFNKLQNGDIKDLNEKMAELENIIIEDPAKALSLPLLKKDLNNLIENHKSDLLNIRNEISRVYDQNKWFIRLMFTMSIGLLGLAIKNIIPAKKKD